VEWKGGEVGREQIAVRRGNLQKSNINLYYLTGTATLSLSLSPTGKVKILFSPYYFVSLHSNYLR